MKYTISSELVNQFYKKYEAVARKATKLGNECTINVSEPYTEKSEDGKYAREVVDIEVTCSYKIEGWKFIASLEWIEEKSENLINQVPGEESVPEMFFRRHECDHCKTTRNRKWTIILKNIETEEYIQVGRACVKDYIGYDVAQYLSYLSLFDNFEEYLESLQTQTLSYGVSEYRTEDALLLGCSFARHYGYISRRDQWDDGVNEWGEYDKPTTVQWVRHFIDRDDKDMSSFMNYKRTPIEDADKALAETVREWVNNQEGIDYHNQQVLFSCEYVTYRNIGFVVGAVGAYLREKAKKEREAIVSNSVHVGEVGQRVELVVTPQTITSWDSEYGVTYLYKFIVDGNEFIWKTGKALNDDLQYNLKGTIKAHTEFNNIKQTELTRCCVEVA